MRIGFERSAKASRRPAMSRARTSRSNIAGPRTKEERLPALARELVRRQVAVITTAGLAEFAAKAATTTIPIVFMSADDPVRRGLVANLARPGGNLTGINFLGGELTAKRLELLREIVPQASRVAVLVNPNGPLAEPTSRDIEPAARHGAANPSPQRQHQWRDCCSVRHFRAPEARLPLHCC